LGAAALAQDAKGHVRVKHIDIHKHYIRPVMLYGDNLGAAALARDVKGHAHVKYNIHKH
jgi:hypothetical protein